MKRFLAVLLAVMMVCTVLAGCGSAEKKAETTATTTVTEAATTAQATETPSFDKSKYPLGMVMILKGHPVVQIMETGFLDRAKELGYPADLYACDESDAAKAESLGEVAIGKGIKGMVIFIFDASVKALIKKATDAGVKVVSAHTPVKEGEYPGLLGWAACDPVQYGQDAAKAIGAQVGGKGTVAITQGAFVPNENAAAAAFKEQMNKDYPDIKVLDPIEEGFDPAIAVSRATAIVQANADLVGAFGITGGSPSTWAGAQDQTGKKLVCIGMDYSRQNLDLVKSGKIYAIVAQPLFEEFAMSVDLLDQALQGKTVKFDNLMGAPIVTVDKLDQYYEYLKKVDAAFANK